jgi:hypothetical protein
MKAHLDCHSQEWRESISSQRKQHFTYREVTIPSTNFPSVTRRAENSGASSLKCSKENKNKMCQSRVPHPMKISFKNKGKSREAPVAHTCNTSYSRSRDQEDCGLKPAPGKQFKGPYLNHKKGMVE